MTGIKGLEWHEYVARVIDGDRQIDASRKSGIDQATISRWLREETSHARRSSQLVRKFARAYDRPVLEAFVVAGFLTDDEAELRVTVALPDLRSMSSHDLIAELDRRLG